MPPIKIQLTSAQQAPSLLDQERELEATRKQVQSEEPHLEPSPVYKAYQSIDTSNPAAFNAWLLLHPPEEDFYINGKVEDSPVRVEVEQRRKARIEQGKVIYGDKGYLDRDLYKEAEEELLDFINYVSWQSEKDSTKSSFLNFVAEKAVKLFEDLRHIKNL